MNIGTGQRAVRGDPLRIRSIAPLALEMPLARPVASPMMSFSSVVTLLVSALDEDGIEGWGEIWCNFPRFGIHHRARLLKEVFAPQVAGHSFASPQEAWERLNRANNVLRLQSGEPGPVAAVAAGIDIALHDIAAKRAGLPLWRMLGGNRSRVPVYASMGRAVDPLPTAEHCLALGFRAFKLHSAGSVDDHVAEIRPVRELIGPSNELMLDVNASWDAREAIATVSRLEEYRLSFLEEPIPCDAPQETWRRLAHAAPMPLAGGENLLSAEAFDAVVAQGALGVLQPDVTKWGGLSGCLPLARRILGAGRRFFPHMFGGAPGVLASAHLLAAAGGPGGMLEFGVG
ncbi:MAG: mandelate racemase/muconate lactonizing enzyme family protein, partial [Burkholderiales bacterium]|nr:mandelate racemase/muconate lactonizing enzyme family protein [Burkholderiales bacterium]